MESRFGGRGRPSLEEISRQKREFRALIAAGVPINEAWRRARIKPERALDELTSIVQSLDMKAAA
jgi:hypothetical protein